MATFSPMIIAMTIGSIIVQLVGIYLFPLTEGFTRPLPTITALICFAIGTALVARIAYAGVSLSAIIPLMAALVPLGGVAIAIIFYGEPASIPKVGMLVAACVLIGASNMA